MAPSGNPLPITATATGHPAGAYAPFIDGLRAVSILAVVGYHVGLPGFSGGFIGVDVFFVISGCLIITQIVSQCQSGTFSLADFWARRALRILPPFSLVVGVSTVLAPVILVEPKEMSDFAASAVFSSAMLANHFFYSQQGYFDTAAELKPLLHTWTLSVEEQFYVIAPLLLVGLFWIGNATKPRVLLVSVASTVLVGSLIACIANTTPAQNAAFFLMPFRVWEFAAGGLVVSLVPLLRRTSNGCCEIIAVIGALAIIVPIGVYSERLLYPSYYPVLPVAGAVALITAGLVQPNITTARLLAATPCVTIGLLSYSWYLWHWPLLAFVRIYDFRSRQFEANLAAVGLSFVLAAATYLLLERPLKRARGNAGVGVWLGGIAAVLVLGTVGFSAFVTGSVFAQRPQGAWATTGYPQRIGSWWTNGDPCSLDTLPITGLDPRCANAPWIKSFGFLMGDSHAMTAFATYQEEARARGIQLVTRVDRSCPPLLNTRILDKGVPMISCIDGMRQAAGMLSTRLAGRVTVAILKASWTEVLNYPISRDPPVPRDPNDALSVLTDRLRLTIDAFRRMGVKRILVVGPEPVFKSSARECLLRADNHRRNRDPCGEPRKLIEQAERPTISAIYRATEGQSDVRMVDAVAALCTDNICPKADDTDVLYVDNAHLTHAGERRLYELRRGDFEWVLTGAEERMGASSLAD